MFSFGTMSLFVTIAAMVLAVGGLGLAIVLRGWVLKQDEGTPRMREIAEACFRFLPTRGKLDLLGYEEPDIFHH